MIIIHVCDKYDSREFIFFTQIPCFFCTNFNSCLTVYDDDRCVSGADSLFHFTNEIEGCTDGWRKVCAEAMLAGVPIPAMTSALNYFDGIRTARMSANLLQAQRDYFGAHTYERVDAPRGEFFHTDWTGHGGNTTANTYNA